jgi:hypothetical protein
MALSKFRGSRATIVTRCVKMSVRIPHKVDDAGSVNVEKATICDLVSTMVLGKQAFGVEILCHSASIVGGSALPFHVLKGKDQYRCDFYKS